MVPSREHSFEKDIVAILSAPEAYVSGDSAGGVSLLQLLEALAAIPVWSWISREILVTQLQMKTSFEMDGGFVRFLGQKLPGELLNNAGDKTQRGRAIFYLPDPETSQDGYSDGVVFETFPSDLWCQQLRARHAAIGHERTLVYTTLDAALLVSWALCGNLKMAHVRAVPNAAISWPLTPIPKSEVAFMASAVEPRDLKQVPKTLLSEPMDKVLQFVWMQQTLFLDETSAQTVAAKYLFQIMPQAEAESFLAAHLLDSDPSVRVNVLHALSVPTSSIGFVPGAPLPPRNIRLEHAALGVSTVSAILALAEKEQNQAVLDGIVATLSAQPFEGVLRERAPEVSTTVLGLIPRLKSAQSARDARKLVHELHKMAEP